MLEEIKPEESIKETKEELAKEDLVKEIIEDMDIQSHTDDSMASNNWVIHGNHTKTGKPLLANDPHLSN